MVGFSLTKTFEDDALLRVFALDAQVFEVARVPERVEVALDGDGIVGVAGMGKQARQDGLLGNAPVADDANLPPGTTPPFIIQYNASSVPVLQLGLSGQG
jgi:hypothetical protein